MHWQVHIYEHGIVHVMYCMHNSISHMTESVRKLDLRGTTTTYMAIPLCFVAWCLKIMHTTLRYSFAVRSRWLRRLS